ncbi:condensation domain-containing protein [Nocardia aurantia]|uniref:Condensation domain-containing protein n=1 Tax=Nocardia aurantia TaxID=2585199 RepID=A0A7K0DME4_9NOCA|nr:hypothetical protein [Nocardia aurantia]MQY26482.1 hypothetical protein [Nocardia aurantia]
MELRSAAAVAPAPRSAAPSHHGITTSFALRCTGYLYAVGLRDAFADLVARHEPLRARGPETPHPAPELVPRLVATAESPSAITEFLGSDLETPIAARSFRLLGDPADLDAPPEHVLVLILHRRAAYRVPPPQLARDLMTAYAARRRNVPPNWAVRRLDGHLHVHELRSVQLYQPATAVFDRLAPLGTAV